MDVLLLSTKLRSFLICCFAFLYFSCMHARVCSLTCYDFDRFYLVKRMHFVYFQRNPPVWIYDLVNFAHLVNFKPEFLCQFVRNIWSSIQFRLSQNPWIRFRKQNKNRMNCSRVIRNFSKNLENFDDFAYITSERIVRF